MTRTLKSEGLTQNNLFRVEGADLVENYNRALQMATGKRTALDFFSLDKRGESPEIEEELGKNYLQSGPSHRYLIVVSPDQKNAPLIHEEFSFDNEVIDFLYNNYMPGISIATRVDGLYGELEDGVRSYESLEDLLMIKKIHAELHTPSGFLTKSRELQGYVKQLQADPSLLLKNDSQLPKNIFELIKQVGDVRDCNLAEIQATLEIDSFSSRIFDGMYVFRNYDHRASTVEPRRPALSALQVAIGKLEGSDADLNKFFTGEEEQNGNGKSKSMVIYHYEGYKPKAGPTVEFLQVSSSKVVDFLIDNGYAVLSQEQIDPRLNRLEDQKLLELGLSVANMSSEQRQSFLHQHRDEMPNDWYELRNLQRQINLGHDFRLVVDKLGKEQRKMLLVPAEQDEPTTRIVNGLLTKLWPLDYEKMYQHNLRDLEHIFENLHEEPRTQDYIVKVLKEAQNNS